jgi:hypothetical protein
MNAEEKARRLLVEGRVRILCAEEDGGFVAAEIRGDSARVYIAGYDEGRWHCNCPARTRCSHVRALQLVFVLEPRA